MFVLAGLGCGCAGLVSGCSGSYWSRSIPPFIPSLLLMLAVVQVSGVSEFTRSQLLRCDGDGDMEMIGGEIAGKGERRAIAEGVGSTWVG